jgi:pentatricopeptide repeat protein
MRTTCLPDRSTFNVLLQGLVSSATSVGKAMEFFTLMESEGWADTRSFIYLSNGLRQAEQTQEMHAFLKALFTKHGYTNQEVCLAHLHNLCHLGSIGEAEEVFTSMVAQTEGPNMPAYATMISAYCRLEKYDDAMELFEQLRLGGQKPSSFCYTPLIGAMLKKKRISNAMRYFEEMVELGIEVNGITCNLLLEELCEQGMVQDASAVVRMMLANKLTIRSEVLFLLMKCFYMQQKGGDADSLFLDMARMHCLPHSNGVLQTMGVMEKMGLHAH